MQPRHLEIEKIHHPSISGHAQEIRCAVPIKIIPPEMCSNEVKRNEFRNCTYFILDEYEIFGEYI